MYESQAKVSYFANMHKLDTSVETRLLDLLAELGELSKEVLKGGAYGKQPFIETTGWVEELGDVYFALLCLANQTDVDLENALDHVLSKYSARMDTGGAPSSGR
jgi:NTP pyrophosphatase (non-canonical NTP hydrolase)